MLSDSFCGVQHNLLPRVALFLMVERIIYNGHSSSLSQFIAEDCEPGVEEHH